METKKGFDDFYKHCNSKANSNFAGIESCYCSLVLIVSQRFGWQLSTMTKEQERAGTQNIVSATDKHT
ncbi:hypothetical protein BDF20DRAFT_850375 [Mycotypha africana]|uniref:uncharacterized protein n=1 Tax=Mycotypha africana TaxID=64632 RepID=UPI002300FC99|nr:uncharacterized protein BDF20DRAFT_850375 [Mycotypha africana]KAI8987456.1 hypothetical protein BDF20DRAFT_850375 [Mycotypha africana]